MTFDPRPYLDAIAEEVDCGNEIDCPATTAQRIRWAGKEIDRLRAEVTRLTAEVANQIAHYDALWVELVNARAERDANNSRVAHLLDEVAKSNAERDEARREVCSVLSGFDPRRAKTIAKHRGWDCFDASQANATDVPVQNGGA